MFNVPECERNVYSHTHCLPRLSSASGGVAARGDATIGLILVAIEAPESDLPHGAPLLIKVHLLVPVEPLPMSTKRAHARRTARRHLLDARICEVVHMSSSLERLPAAGSREEVVREEAYAQAAPIALAVAAPWVDEAYCGLVALEGRLEPPRLCEHERPAVLVGDVIPAQVELDETPLDGAHQEADDALTPRRGRGRAHVDKPRVRRGAHGANRLGGPLVALHEYINHPLMELVIPPMELMTHLRMTSLVVTPLVVIDHAHHGDLSSWPS